MCIRDRFYKPKNYVSSRSRQGNSKTIYDLIKNKKLKYSGRLDKESEGLMLLSTDGNWLNNNAHPSKQMDKKYIVSTNIEEKDLAKFIQRSNFFLTCIGNEFGKARYIISKKLEKKLSPISIISKKSYVSNMKNIGKGAQLFPGSILNENSYIGDLSLIHI